jgi:hypothetical protein
LLLALAGVAWSERVALVTWGATGQLERQGFGPAALVVDAVDLYGFHAHDLTLRGDALRVRAVSVAYNPLDLIGAHVDRVDLAGLDLTLAVGATGATLGGKPLGGAEGDTAFTRWRIDTIALSDARLSVVGQTPVEATLAATVALGGGVISAKDVAAVIAVPAAGKGSMVHVAAHGITLTPGATGSPLLAVAQASVTPDDLPWTATGIDGTLRASGDRLTAELNLARLANLAQPALVAPLRLAAEASLSSAAAEATLHATTVAPSPLDLKATARYDRSSSSVATTLGMAPLVFHRGSSQPSDLFPALALLGKDVEGSVRLTGSIDWRQGELSPRLAVRFDDLAFSTAMAQVRALTGTLVMNRLWPPATPPGQHLTAIVEAPGLPPAKVSFGGQLTAKSSLRLEQLAVEIAGGKIAAAPFTVDHAAPAVDTVLAVDHVDIAEITKLLGVDGLKGTGALDGHIPVRFDEGKVSIAAGRLAARAPGTLSYLPHKLPSEVATAGESVDLVLRALSDFRYDALSLDLDKSAEGEGTVKLQLQGNNPAVMSGHPFNINIRLDSNFDRLADLALLSVRSAQDVLRRAAGRAKP